MADNTVEEEKKEIHEEAQDAKEAVAAGNTEDANAKISDIEARVAALEVSVANERDKAFAPADHNHDHQLPPGYKQLVESLKEMEEEEHAPENLPWFKKPIFGK